MWRQVAFAVLVLAVVVQARVLSRRKRTLEEHGFSDCGGPSKKMIFHHMSFNPRKLSLPGNVSIDFQAELIDTIQNMDVAVRIWKRMGNQYLGFWMEIPCVREVGSCTYDNICGRMQQQDPATEPILVTLRRAMEQAGAPSTCPMDPRTVNLHNLRLDMPAPQIMAASVLIDGAYHMNFRMHEPGNPNREYGCLELSAHIGTA